MQRRSYADEGQLQLGAEDMKYLRSHLKIFLGELGGRALGRVLGLHIELGEVGRKGIRLIPGRDSFDRHSFTPFL